MPQLLSVLFPRTPHTPQASVGPAHLAACPPFSRAAGLTPGGPAWLRSEQIEQRHMTRSPRWHTWMYMCLCVCCNFQSHISTFLCVFNCSEIARNDLDAFRVFIQRVIKLGDNLFCQKSPVCPNRPGPATPVDKGEALCVGTLTSTLPRGGR